MSRDDEFIDMEEEVHVSGEPSALVPDGVGETAQEPTAEEQGTAESSEGGGESLERYLREVSRWSLLSAEAERDLARRTAKGDAAALEDLINRNLRLVVYWAKRYRSSGLP